MTSIAERARAWLDKPVLRHLQTRQLIIDLLADRAPRTAVVEAAQWASRTWTENSIPFPAAMAHLATALAALDAAEKEKL